MSAGDLVCRDDRRRQLIRDRNLNGVDSVEVSGTHLCVFFLTGIPPEFLPRRRGGGLTPEEKAAAMAHIVIRGGRRVTGIVVTDIDPDPARSEYEEGCLGIDLDAEGDWSTYTVCFVETQAGRPTDAPLRSLDPRYACADFTFKIECPAEIDCRSEALCAPEERPSPAISYLAKDYATFRRLILDRLALTMPQWRERHVPDLAIALVEVLAYAADYLSYFQDAVATEQYLDTARRRISVRRHARLVDYAMHEGCNARVFVELRVQRDTELDPREFYFVTRITGAPVVLRQSRLDGMPAGWLAFEPMTVRPALELRLAHNLIRIYTWGDEECCLPKGATRATLLDELEEHDALDPAICDERPWPPIDHDHHDECGCGQKPPPPPPTPRSLDLEAGDFLLFEELACAGTAYRSAQPGDGGFDGKTPQPDADRTHRHVVRLTKVTKRCDALRGNRLVEVEWSLDDALPFALCISSIGMADACDLVRDLAVARGNVVLADHGATIRDEPLPTVPQRPAPEACEGEDEAADVERVAARYSPRLRHSPLTHAQAVDAGASAAAMLRQDPRRALPAISLAAVPPSADGITPLFRPEDLLNLETLAKALFAPAEPPAMDESPAMPDESRKHSARLVVLRRRLRVEVREMLDQALVTEPLLAALEGNLRDLTESWSPRADLIDTGFDDPAFVAEVDDDGVAWLRFGDGDCGRALEVGSAFLATYRAGNGRPGLTGAESIDHVVFRRGFDDVITGVRNPLPSSGAVDPEPVAEVKMLAPGEARTGLERAVTADDYATLAQYVRYPERNTRVQSASGALRWNGSWYEADVAIDPKGTSDLDPSLQASIERTLYRYRRMGHDLRVGVAEIVPIRLELDLCVKPDYLRAHVLAGVRDALSSRALPGGKRGLFHPDNLSFGGAVFVSRIVRAVMEVDGVAEVEVVLLERLGRRKHRNPDLAKGLLALGPNEIARLDNDPTIPENGLLRFRHVRGGR